MYILCFCFVLLQLMRLVDMLVALSISEDSIYPLIQSFVWDKIGGEPRLLKRVLDSFIRVSIPYFELCMYALSTTYVAEYQWWIQGGFFGCSGNPLLHCSISFSRSFALEHTPTAFTTTTIALLRVQVIATSTCY